MLPPPPSVTWGIYIKTLHVLILVYYNSETSINKPILIQDLATPTQVSLLLFLVHSLPHSPLEIF